jgi:transposase
MSHRPTDSTNRNGSKPVSLPDPEVKASARRRVFTTEYKLAILDEVEARRESGSIGAFLRSEGLYSSNITDWRRQRDAGELTPGRAKKRGRKANPEAAELAKLQRENERLRAQLQQAELIIGAQKKLAQALEKALSEQEDEPS